jgi:flagellar motor switch protein FliN
MTAASASNLSRAKIHRLLQAVGSAPTQTEPDVEASAYDWRDPHYFNEDQRNRLAAMMTQGAALLSDRFVHFYHSEFNVKATSIKQHYAADLNSHIRLDEGFSLPFGPDADHPCGFLAVGAEVALNWATRLLGDSESNDEPGRVISSLEESLLSDLLAASAEAVLESLGDSQNLQAGSNLCRSGAAVPYGPTEEICHVVFQIQEAEAEETAELSFVLPCSTLAPAVGKALAAEVQPSAEQLARLLMEHVQKMPVTVTAHLAAIRLSFEEVLDLGPDDVLLIDKPIEEPMDVIVDGRTVFRGRPAQSNGQYAVFVTECTTESARPTTPPPATP